MHSFPSTKSSLLILLCFLGGVVVPGFSAKDYWEAGLKQHNEYRAAHNTPLLELDSGLAELADKCAQYYADKGQIDHTCPDLEPRKHGENLFQSFGSNMDGAESVKYATKQWYDEIKDYDFNKHGAKGGGVVGHFTQVVWKSSKQFGIGFVKNEKGSFVVGLYTPAGNIIGLYKDNVLPPSGGGAGGGSDKSSASIQLSLIRGQNGYGTIFLTLVMNVGLVAGGF